VRDRERAEEREAKRAEKWVVMRRESSSWRSYSRVLTDDKEAGLRYKARQEHWPRTTVEGPI